MSVLGIARVLHVWIASGERVMYMNEMDYKIIIELYNE